MVSQMCVSDSTCLKVCLLRYCRFMQQCGAPASVGLRMNGNDSVHPGGRTTESLQGEQSDSAQSDGVRLDILWYANTAAAGVRTSFQCRSVHPPASADVATTAMCKNAGELLTRKLFCSSTSITGSRWYREYAHVYSEDRLAGFL